jgi:hypothetical protein
MTAPKLETGSAAWPLLVLLGPCIQGCLLPLEEHARLRDLGHAICNGRGEQIPVFWAKRHFDLLLDLLEHPQEHVRTSTATALQSNHVRGGRHYSKLGDAYIDSGRSGDLMEALWRAWQTACPGSLERYRMAQTFVDCRCVQYVWEHPNVATEVNFERSTGGERGWSGTLVKRDLQLLAPKVVQDGDERFRTVWEDYQHLLRIRPWRMGRGEAPVAGGE